jgi:hypothetical protein
VVVGLVGREGRWGRWHVHRVPLTWPQINFFIWGHLSSLVYETSVETGEHLAAIVPSLCGPIQGQARCLREGKPEHCASLAASSNRSYELLENNTIKTIQYKKPRNIVKMKRNI